MQAQDTTVEPEGLGGEARRTRSEATALLAEFESALTSGMTERGFAESRGVPRTTLRYWRERKERLDGDPEVVAFFESPAGLAFLHRMIIQIHLIFCQAGPCGVDRVSQLLKSTGLSAFVGSSHGSQHAVSEAMGREIRAFGRDQEERLASGMRARPILIAADETWLTEMALVAIDPRSNYVVAEEYAENRDAETWHATLNAKVAALPVNVVGVAADEGSGLGRMIETLLGIQKAPDIFHVQRDLWKALGQAITRSLTGPSEEVVKAAADLTYWQDRWERHEAGDRPVGRPPFFERHISNAEEELAAASGRNETVLHEAALAEDAIRMLSLAYHPIDLATGELRSTPIIQTALDKALATVEAAAERLSLPSKAYKRIAKAKRVLPKLTAAVRFFFDQIDQALEPLDVDDDLQHVFRECLVPAFYLQDVAHRGRRASERDRIRELGRRLLARARAPDSPFGLLPDAKKAELETLAADCASLFAWSISWQGLASSSSSSRRRGNCGRWPRCGGDGGAS